MPISLKQEAVSKERLRRLAARWHDAEGSGRTYCLPPGRPPPETLSLPDAVRATLAASETGAVLFWSLARSHLVLPPFPIDRAAEYPGWHAGPLQSLLDRPHRVLVLLLRLGGYAVGIFEGERLVSSKTGSPLVHGRHRKGGSSSGRFARRREEQARVLFDKVCQALREQVEGYEGRLESLVLGGDRLTLLAFEKRCPHLRPMAAIRLRRVLNVPDPRLAVLKETPRLIYSSQVITFTPELPASPSAA